MITYKEYISEGITFDGEDLRFLYNDNSKDLVSTKFGKSKKFTPFVTTIEKELKAYSLYNSRDATATLKAIKAADFEAVIIAGRWMWYFEHQPYGGRIDLPKAYLVSERVSNINERSTTTDSSRQVWQQQLQATVKSIQLQGSKVVLFSQF